MHDRRRNVKKQADSLVGNIFFFPQISSRQDFSFLPSLYLPFHLLMLSEPQGTSGQERKRLFALFCFVNSA